MEYNINIKFETLNYCLQILTNVGGKLKAGKIPTFKYSGKYLLFEKKISALIKFALPGPKSGWPFSFRDNGT